MTAAAKAGVEPVSTRLLLVCGPWGSGTSLVAQLLAHLGVPSIEPFYKSNDIRTPNSFESAAFRNGILYLTDEFSLSLRNPTREEVLPQIKLFRNKIEDGKFGFRDSNAPIFLKYPPSALFLPEICTVFDTRLIYVLRPCAEIEATRTRRGWRPHTGTQGAEVIYAHMFRFLVDSDVPTLIIKYHDILRQPDASVRRLHMFSGLDCAPEILAKARTIIRSPDWGPG